MRITIKNAQQGPDIKKLSEFLQKASSKLIRFTKLYSNNKYLCDYYNKNDVTVSYIINLIENKYRLIFQDNAMIIGDKEDDRRYMIYFLNDEDAEAYANKHNLIIHA